LLLAHESDADGANDVARGEADARHGGAVDGDLELRQIRQPFGPQVLEPVDMTDDRKRSPPAAVNGPSQAAALESWS
jgi:hypothetical protein